MPLQPRDHPCARAGDRGGQFLRVLGRVALGVLSPELQVPVLRVEQSAALAGNPAGASRRPVRAAASPLQPQALRVRPPPPVRAPGLRSARAASGLPHRARRMASRPAAGRSRRSGAAGAAAGAAVGARARRGVEALRAQYGGEEVRVDLDVDLRIGQLVARVLVGRDQRPERAGCGRPLRVRRRLYEHGVHIGGGRVEFERVVGDRLLALALALGCGCRVGVRARLGGARRCGGGLGCGGLRYLGARPGGRLAFLGEARERVEDARAAPAAHVALGDAQVGGGHHQGQRALWTDCEHAGTSLSGAVRKGRPSRRGRQSGRHQSTGHKRLSRPALRAPGSRPAPPRRRAAAGPRRRA